MAAAAAATLGFGVVVATDGPHGRSLRCTRPVPCGALLLTETPFAHVLDRDHSASLCQRCLRGAAADPCAACGLVGYCGPVCREADRTAHARECRSARQVRPHTLTPTLRLVLRVLRGLEDEERTGRRRESDRPPAGTRFQELTSHIDDLPAEMREQYAQLSKLVRDCLLPGEELGACAHVHTMIEVFAKLATNTFHLLDDDLQPIGSGLFLVAAALNHSCRPNAAAVFNGPTLTVRATEDIAEGAEVTISYIDVAATTEERRRPLRDRYSFECSCDLCASDGGRDVALGALATACDVRRAAHRDRLATAARLAAEGQRLRTAGQPSAALEAFAQALTASEGLLGTRHLLRHRILDGATHSAIDAEDFEGALDHCTASLPGYNYLYGGHHPMVGLQHATHAKLAAYAGDAEAGERSTRAALDVLLVTHGPGHPVVQRLREWHAGAQCAG